MMRSLVCVRRLIPAALCLAAASLGVAAARADEAEQLRSDVAAGLESMFAMPAQEKSFSYEGVDVTGATPPYDVAIRGIRLGTPEFGQTELGTVTFRLAPVGEGVYAVSDLRLPSPVSFHDATGAVSGTFTIGNQSFKGVWSAALRTFLSMDGSFSDIRAADATGKTVLQIAGVAVNGDSTEVTPGHWDQKARFTLTDLTAGDEGGGVSLAAMEAGSEMHGLDMPAFEKLMNDVRALSEAAAEATSAPDGTEGPATEPQEGEFGGDQAGPAGEEGSGTNMGVPEEGEAGADAALAPGPGPAEQAVASRIMETLRGLPTLFADASTSFSVHGLRVRDAGGKEIVSLGEGGIEFGLSGLDTPRAGFRFAYRHLGLKADWSQLDEGTPPDPQAQQIVDALAPQDVVLDLRLEDLPGKELWQAFLDTVGDQESLADVEGASALFGLGAVGTLQQAGSRLRLVESRLVSNSASVLLDGVVQADAKTPMGATGALNVEISGLDGLIQLVKANANGPDAAEETAPLELLRAFSERRTEADGRVVDRYVLSLDQSGALLLNGKDFQFLLNAMGGASDEPGAAPEKLPQDGGEPDAEQPAQ